MKQREKAEREFFYSLSQLASLYGFTLSDVSEVPFPLNVAQAFQTAKMNMEAINRELELIIGQDDNHSACVATVETFSIGMRLYYIPVQPLIKLLRTDRKSPVAMLLLSVFSYLHTEAGVPWFHKCNSYIAGCYETLKEWFWENYADYEEDDANECIAEIKEMQQGASFLYKKIKRPISLTIFNRRIQRFRPSNSVEVEVLRLATEAIKLIEVYPQQNIFSLIPDGLREPEVEDRIFPESYLSFNWSFSGWLDGELEKYVNDQLQECAVMDEPMSVQWFDAPQNATSHDLTFQKTLFCLINDLCTVLNELP